jgi:hypothetical protein
MAPPAAPRGLPLERVRPEPRAPTRRPKAAQPEGQQSLTVQVRLSQGPLLTAIVPRHSSRTHQ